MGDDEIIRRIERILSDSDTNRQGLQQVMNLLGESRPDYYWVGIYVLHGETLHLGPYHGPESDHKRIPVGRGVCGTAVAENKNQVIGDVRELDNYLACNLQTRAEIVVLIRDHDTHKILGQIDVDGTRVDAFKNEENFLERVAMLCAPFMANVTEGAETADPHAGES